jgi:hypothetical protein
MHFQITLSAPASTFGPGGQFWIAISGGAHAPARRDICTKMVQV